MKTVACPAYNILADQFRTRSVQQNTQSREFSHARIISTIETLRNTTGSLRLPLLACYRNPRIQQGIPGLTFYASSYAFGGGWFSHRVKSQFCRISN